MPHQGGPRPGEGRCLRQRREAGGPVAHAPQLPQSPSSSSPGHALTPSPLGAPTDLPLQGDGRPLLPTRPVMCKTPTPAPCPHTDQTPTPEPSSHAHLTFSQRSPGAPGSSRSPRPGAQPASCIRQPTRGCALRLSGFPLHRCSVIRLRGRCSHGDVHPTRGLPPPHT